MGNLIFDGLLFDLYVAHRTLFFYVSLCNRNSGKAEDRGRTCSVPSWSHVEPGAREKALLADDPNIRRFKSHKKGVARIKRIGDVFTIVVVAGCCYEIYVKAVMREEAWKQARAASGSE